MAISFEAIGEKVVTFAAGSGLEAGKVCKVTANGTVGACEENDSFCGVCAQVRGGTASVVMEGYTELSCSGTEPALGYAALAADSEGGVCVKSGGREYLVVKVDAQNHIVGLFL